MLALLFKSTLHTYHQSFLIRENTWMWKDFLWNGVIVVSQWRSLSLQVYYLSSFSGYNIAQEPILRKLESCIKWPVATWATGRTCADSRKVIDKTGVRLVCYICSAVIGPPFFVPRFPHGCGNKKSVPAGHTKNIIEFRYRRVAYFFARRAKK